MLNNRITTVGRILTAATLAAMALTSVQAQTVSHPTREDILRVCGPEIQRSMAAEKATTPRYLLDALYTNFVEDGRYNYLMALLPDKRTQAAKYPDSQAPAEVCTIELVVGLRKG